MIPSIEISEISFVLDDKIIHAKVNDISIRNGVIIFTLQSEKYHHLLITSLNSKITRFRIL